MKKVKIAIIGCGAIANFAHLPVLKDICEIVYAVDLVKERADNVVKKFGAKKSCTDYKEILDSDEFQAVFLTLPNCYHDVLAIEFMQHGKDVFCEKPAAMNYERALNMQKVAVENNRILHIGVCMRFMEAVERIKQLVDAGELGELYHIVCNFRSYRGIPGIGGHFTTKEMSGGGVLQDWGIHRLDLALYVAGITDIKNVNALYYNKLGAKREEYIANFNYSFTGDKQKDVEEFVTGVASTDKCGITFMGAWAQNIKQEDNYIDFLGTKAGIRYTYCGNFEISSQKYGVLYTSVPELVGEDMYLKEDREFLNCVLSRSTESKGNIKNVLSSSKLIQMSYDSSSLENLK